MLRAMLAMQFLVVASFATQQKAELVRAVRVLPYASVRGTAPVASAVAGSPVIALPHASTVPVAPVVPPVALFGQHALRTYGSDVPYVLLAGMGLLGIVGAIAFTGFGPQETGALTATLGVLAIGLLGAIGLVVAVVGGFQEWGALIVLLLVCGAAAAAGTVPCLYFTAKGGSELDI